MHNACCTADHGGEKKRATDLDGTNRQFCFVFDVCRTLWHVHFFLNLVKACMGVAGLISTKSTSLGNDGACMQCDPANNVSEYPTNGLTTRILRLLLRAMAVPLYQVAPTGPFWP